MHTKNEHLTLRIWRLEQISKKAMFEAEEDLKKLRKSLVHEVKFIVEEAMHQQFLNISGQLNKFISELDSMKRIIPLSDHGKIDQLIEYIKGYQRSYEQASKQGAFGNQDRQKASSFTTSMIGAFKSTILKDLDKEIAHMKDLLREYSLKEEF